MTAVRPATLTITVRAAEMRPGDVWHMHDWLLHIVAVDVQGGNVAVVTEGPQMSHVPADELEEIERAA